MKINVNCKGAQCADAPKDEATSGNVKGRKNVMDAINRGYIFEALDIAHEITESALSEVDQADEALAGCKEKLEELDKLRDQLNEIGAAALRASITNLYSPEVARDTAREKTLKDAVKLLYEIFGDLDAGREMVLTYTSSLATNAKKALLQGKNAIEVTQQDLKDNDLTGDSKELVTFTKAKDRQANAGLAKELAPLIDQAKVVAEAAGEAADATVPASAYKDLLTKLTEMYDNASKITKVITTTPDFQPSELIKKLKTTTESKQEEGLLETIVDAFKKLASGLQAAFVSLKKSFTDLFGDVEQANDTYAKTSETLMAMGFAPTEATVPATVETPAEKKESFSFAKLGSLIGKAFEMLEKDPRYEGFIDEVYSAETAWQKVQEDVEGLRGSLEALKGIGESSKDEDNMEVISILADAITRIADTEEGEETSDVDQELADQVSDTYSNPEERPAAEEEPPAGEEPEEEPPMA